MNNTDKQRLAYDLMEEFRNKVRSEFWDCLSVEELGEKYCSLIVDLRVLYDYDLINEGQKSSLLEWLNENYALEISDNGD